VLATTDHGAPRMPLSPRTVGARAKHRAEVRCTVPAPRPPAANLCPGCGPVADELSSRFCAPHGAALRAAVATWRAARAAP